MIPRLAKATEVHVVNFSNVFTATSLKFLAEALGCEEFRIQSTIESWQHDNLAMTSKSPVENVHIKKLPLVTTVDLDPFAKVTFNFCKQFFTGVDNHEDACDD